ncbi:MAG: hypothetical protein ACI8UO_000314 [Verrucomicrobiales bacterium]|jgi:hypothetical protein
MKHQIHAFVCLLMLTSPLALHAAEDEEDAFTKTILPILKERCFECHSGDDPKAKLDLSGLGLILKGGKNGAAIRAGAAESSLLWEKIAGNEMPKEGAPLTAEEKGIIRTWINDGAKGDAAIVESAGPTSETGGGSRDHWSFQPPRRPRLPDVMENTENGIDAFLLADLEKEGLTFSQEADRGTLIRRLSYNLIGLPPTPEEVNAFVTDPDDRAWERVVDRLLASPRYGERWGRHWLDVAGYADSAGILNEDRVLAHAYRYRDYVIQAFNDDKPYDVFLLEQIAGDELYDYWTADATLDELPEQVVEGVIATGYLRCAADPSRPDFKSIKTAKAEYFYPTLNDTLQIVASSTMGLTLQCAKCHSHLYDPIPQVDYYRMQAVFMGAYRPTDWVPQMDRKLTIETAARRKVVNAHNAEIDTKVKALQKVLTDLHAPLKGQLFEKRLAALLEIHREAVREAFATAADKRDSDQQLLVEKHKAQLQPTAKALETALTESFPDYKAEADRVNQAVAAANADRIPFEQIRALYDLPGPVETPFLRRGDPLTPGQAVEPGVLTALTTEQAFAWVPPPEDAVTSGRRLAFAEWLTQPNHPLTGRVMVNRVWLHHFGEGLVRTAEDFGHSGEPPANQQLLDWLTREFIDNGWSVKALHRLILTSRAYRQSSTLDESEPTHSRALKLDPDNRLLWRQRLQRLEAEPMRDAVLAVAGTLNLKMFGEPVPTKRLPTGEVMPSSAPPDSQRRSIYLRVRRSEPLTVLQAFDQPVMETNCIRRSRSTVSTQALTLSNSDFMIESANAFAKRVLQERPDEPIGRALELAFSRKMSELEESVLGEFVKAQEARHAENGLAEDEARWRAMADLCHQLLNANEFVYID